MTEPQPKPRPRPQLVRVAPGTTIHVSTCPSIRRSFNIPWPPAADRNAFQISILFAEQQLLPCRRCKPIRTLETWEYFTKHPRTLTPEAGH